MHSFQVWNLLHACYYCNPLVPIIKTSFLINSLWLYKNPEESTNYGSVGFVSLLNSIPEVPERLQKKPPRANAHLAKTSREVAARSRRRQMCVTIGSNGAHARTPRCGSTAACVAALCNRVVKTRSCDSTVDSH